MFSLERSGVADWFLRFPDNLNPTVRIYAYFVNIPIHSQIETIYYPQV